MDGAMYYIIVVAIYCCAIVYCINNVLQCIYNTYEY
jgi:hypothetical protein